MNDRITITMTDGTVFAINSLSGVAAVETLITLYGDAMPTQMVPPCKNCKKYHEYCDEGMATCKAHDWNKFERKDDTDGHQG